MTRVKKTEIEQTSDTSVKEHSDQVLFVINHYHRDMLEPASGMILTAGEKSKIILTVYVERGRVLANIAQLNQLHGDILEIVT